MDLSRVILGFLGEFSGVNGNSTARVSTEAGEVEVNGDGVAFGRNYLHGHEIGGEGVGREFQINGSAPGTARAIATAAIERAAARIGGGKNLATVIDLDPKVFPEISGAREQRLGRARA